VGLNEDCSRARRQDAKHSLKTLFEPVLSVGARE